MSDTMKAIVFHGAGQIAVESVPIPDIGPGDVLIKVKVCGICGTDVHTYRAGTFVSPGQILGHEFCGEVVAVGSAVKDIAVGDRVAALQADTCGTCYWCQRGQSILCPDLWSLCTGYGLPGSMAEYVPIGNAVLGTSVFKIPSSMDDEAGALVEPLSCAVSTVAAAGVQKGDKVVVLGAGIIGNGCMQAARAAGADMVLAIDISPKRLEAARLLGADAVFDARSGDSLAWVKQMCGVGRYQFGEGAMADVVIEAAGSPITVQQSFEMVRSGGTIAFVALPEEKTPIDTSKIIYKAPRIIGVLGGDRAKTIAMMESGEIRTTSLVTHRFPLDEAETAFQMQMRPDQAIKVVFKL